MRKFVLTFTDCDAYTRSLAISEKLEPLQKMMIKEASILFYTMYQDKINNSSLDYIKRLILDHIYYDDFSIDINDAACIGLCNPSFSISTCCEV